MQSKWSAGLYYCVWLQSMLSLIKAHGGSCFPSHQLMNVYKYKKNQILFGFHFFPGHMKNIKKKQDILQKNI